MQERQMIVNHPGIKRRFVNYDEIVKSFQDDGTRPNYDEISQTTTEYFYKNKGYGKKIQENVMCDLNLCHSGEIPKFKGCISRMVTTWKMEMVNK